MTAEERVEFRALLPTKHAIRLHPAEFSCVLTWLGNLWAGCAFPSAPVLHLTEQDHALGMYAGSLFDPRADPRDGPIWLKPWAAVWTHDDVRAATLDFVAFFSRA